MTDELMEGVCIRSYHHGNFLQRIRPSSELSPVDPILVAAAVMPTTVPHAIQVGMSTGIVPPSSLLVVGTVTWRHKESNQTNWWTSKLVLCWLRG